MQSETDFAGGANTGLSLTRYYNSQDAGASTFGTKWRSEWHRGLVVSGNTVTVTRSDGRQDNFVNNGGGVYTADPDVRSALSVTVNGGTVTSYQLLTEFDSRETYSPGGPLLSLTTRGGLVTTLTYNSSNLLTTVTGPFGHVLSFAYNTTGNVSQMTAPDGGAYTYAYDGNNNLISATYPDGSKRQYVYGNTSFPNALTGIIDELGNTFATYAYDSQGRATASQHAGGVDLATLTYNGNGSTTATDARGNAHSYTFTTQFGLVKPTGLSGAPVQSAGGQAFTYDSNGFIASRTDWDGNVTTYTHDARGDETSRVEASGTSLARTISTSWLSSFHLPTQIAEPNRTTAYSYDANGNLLSKTIRAGALTRTFSYTYNASGQVLTAIDPNGNVTSYTYDAKGDLASVTNALGQKTNFTSYDGAGRLLSLTDPNGVTTALTYDPRGRLTSRTVGALTTSYAYDKAGNLIQVTRPDGSYLAYSYDGAHRLTGIADAVRDSIVYTLDATSNVTQAQVFDPSNTLRRTRSYAYDSVNRLSQIVGAAGQTTTLAYDAQGNLISKTDPLNHVTSYGYDALNRLAKNIDPNGGTTSLGYDANDHLTSLTDPRGLQTANAWDGFNDRTALASPDSGTTTKTYDAAGNVLTSTDARSKTTTYSYDALNRRTKATFADGSSINWLYDQGAYGIGHLSQVSDATGTTTYLYDANGHVTGKQQITGGVMLTTRYAYDGGGRLARITYPSGKQVTYAYDAAGRVSGATAGSQSLAANVGYFPFGAASGWTEGNGAAYARSFDRDGRIAGLSLPGNDSMSLSYDAASRITGLADSKLSPKVFAYDALDRLTSYTIGISKQTWGYDANSNRASMSQTKGAVTSTVAYNYPATSNRLQSLSGGWSESLSFDANGNTLAHNTPSADYTFSFDAKNRLAQGSLGAITETYGINGLGQRVVKANPSSSTKTLFSYDEAGNLLGEYGPTGSVIEETVWLNGLPVATLQPSGTYYIAPDHLGAPHQITNGGQQVVWLWQPDPFGNGLPAVSLSFSYNLRFPGQYYDATTGLHHNRFRDYDPKSGRYIESDPIGLAGGINTYAYVRSSPISRRDPRGLDGENLPSIIRLTGPNETFIRYETGNQNFCRIGSNGEILPGTFAAPSDEGVLTQNIINEIYNLPSPELPRTQYYVISPPEGTPIIGPRPVSGGTGYEVQFPFGAPPGSSSGLPTEVPVTAPVEPVIFDPYRHLLTPE